MLFLQREVFVNTEPQKDETTMGESNDINYETPRGENRYLPGRGRVLVAAPALIERPFTRSAVIILEADRNNGHIGLILNKRTELEMSDIVSGWPSDIVWPIYCGGPVEPDRLFMLHTLGERFPDSKEIAPGVFIGGHISDFCEYARTHDESEGKIRLFSGYSGWVQNQLEEEIGEGAWIVKAASNADSILMGEGPEYWRREMQAIGPKYGSLSVLPEIQQMN